MRGIALWASGAALAFFVTAGAFLMLANLATGSSEENLPPRPRPGKPGPALNLNLNEGRLASLEPRPDQELLLTVKNVGDEDLSDLNVTLDVSSENTALPNHRYYRRRVEGLAAGGTAKVDFEFDLSAPKTGAAKSPAPAPETPRKILEIRATTPEGARAVRTVLLPP